MLPLLIAGDLVAVALYRRHAVQRHLWRLFPWAGGGVVLGWLAMGHISDAQAARLIGVILAVMLTMHIVRRRAPARKDEEYKGPGAGGGAASHGSWYAPAMGVLAGFTTLVANAAGPVMILYLLAMRLPKLEFIGTSAVFFMLVNWFKVPFMAQLGLIDADSIALNLWLAPAVLAGALVGRAVVPLIDQRAFERLALVLTAAATLKLLLV